MRLVAVLTCSWWHAACRVRHAVDLAADLCTMRLFTSLLLTLFTMSLTAQDLKPVAYTDGRRSSTAW